MADHPMNVLNTLLLSFTSRNSKPMKYLREHIESVNARFVENLPW